MKAKTLRYFLYLPLWKWFLTQNVNKKTTEMFYKYSSGIGRNQNAAHAYERHKMYMYCFLKIENLKKISFQIVFGKVYSV